jgi:hypothetical protein
LASTQTQSYSDNEEAIAIVPNEGSQKENFEMAENNYGKDGQLPSPDCHTPSPQNFSSKDKTVKAGQSGTAERSTKVY